MQQYSDFISQHLNDDARDLALRQSRYPDVDIHYAVGQISAWQMARRKLPLWAETKGIEFPVHLSMEQCSSQLTAEYKASLEILRSAFCKGDANGQFLLEGSMTDLTAGFGVDATMLGRLFSHLNYVERNEALCNIAQNNLPLLGVNDFSIMKADATEVLKSLPHQSLIYLDPARRDEHGGKTVQISDCTPDVSQLQNLLLEKADMVMVKLSPMLDVANIMRELECVREIHIVSVDNECKELLAILTPSNLPNPSNLPTPNSPLGGWGASWGASSIHCVNITKNATQRFVVSDSDREAECHYTNQLATYLYEPNVSIMKAGCFRGVAKAFGVAKLHPSSHLYTSDKLITDFPGRIFKVEAVYSLKDKALKTIKKGNLTVRNFPSSVAELRKRLKLSEGGSEYLFATTLADESKVVVRCVKS